MSDDDFRERMRATVEKLGGGGDEAGPVWAAFTGGFRYVAGDYGDPETFDRLKAVLDELDRERGTSGNRLYYLATPPATFPVIVGALGRARAQPARRPMAPSCASSSRSPTATTSRARATSTPRCTPGFAEEQVYRIDHYLGKETVQNVLALRFANAIFEPIWNRRYVDHVQITVAEELGVGHRGGFYETAGALRDIVQNHVMQVLALTLMEPPATFDADGIRDEKVKALKAVDILSPDEVAEHVVRAQYTRGWVGGEEVSGYRDEVGVDPHSQTETYVAMRLMVDNWRWAGVPFYVRTGKRLPKRVTEVAMEFHRPPHLPFKASQATGLSHRTRSCCASSPTRASPCASAPRSPARRSRCGRSRWTSSTAPPSSRRRPRPTSGCCSTRSSATRRCSSAPTRSSRRGGSSTPS